MAGCKDYSERTGKCLIDKQERLCKDVPITECKFQNTMGGS